MTTPQNLPLLSEKNPFTEGGSLAAAKDSGNGMNDHPGNESAQGRPSTDQNHPSDDSHLAEKPGSIAEANDHGNASSNDKSKNLEDGKPPGVPDRDHPKDVANGKPVTNGKPSKLEYSNPMSYDDARRMFCRDVTHSGATAVLDAKNSDRRYGIHTPHAALTQVGKLWNRGADPIKFTWDLKNGGNDLQRKKVTDAIKEWELYGEFHFANDTSEPDLVIAFDGHPKAGSWSYVGTDSRQYARAGEVTMNLGWIDPFERELNKAERAVILHEFGHVLGMLHEHQSPSSGGVRIENIPAALEFYRTSQGWNDDDIREQVIKMENLRDVSSFSQVDRTSIMQYPMPAVVTGLPKDIEYNYVLSDLDKAYMSIMYPRVSADANAGEWTLAHALDVSGIGIRDKENSDAILEYSKQDLKSDGTIDPTRIREIFSKWSSKAHAASSVARGIQPTPGSTTDTINVFPYEMCENDSSSISAPKGVRHAVIDKSWLERRVQIPAEAEGKDYTFGITWTVIDCPPSLKADPKALPIAATPYQVGLVRQALSDWESAASIKFMEVNDVAKAGIVFVFQKYHHLTGLAIERGDSVNRSYCRARTGVPDNTSGKPPVSHTICYRGISSTDKEAAELSPEVYQFTEAAGRHVDNVQLDLRSVRHEIGHYLGLDHENLGAYGYVVFDPSFNLGGMDAIRKKFTSTRLDTSSIMDVLRRPSSFEQFAKEANGSKDHRLLVRVTCNLSKYDQANIKLLLPGARLADPNSIKDAGETLGLSPDGISQLQGLAKDTQWAKFQVAYIGLLDQMTEEWQKTMTGLDKDIQKLARENNNSIFSEPSAGPKAGPRPSPIRRGLEAGALPEENKAAAPPLLETLYKTLSQTIGPQGGQILTLQFPTRYLDKESFQYELKGIYSNFIKPVVVSEAEFRLTDALYDPAPIVGAPNGRSLSNVYHQVINNFVPRYNESEKNVRIQRERIRNWLLTDAEANHYKFDFNASSTGRSDDAEIVADMQEIARNKSMVRKVTRMEFASQLSQEYYDAQMRWEKDRDDMIQKAIKSNDPDTLASTTRTLVHTSMAEQGKLAMKNADVVVRGYSHVVREALGHLDVATSAEILQDAKDSFRTSAVSSLYGASKVYPVLMSPTDWSTALDTGFALEDLNEKPDMIVMMIKGKAAALDQKKKQLSLLVGNKEGNAADLKAKAEAAADAVNKAEADMQAAWADSTLQLAKIVIAVSSGGASVAGEAALDEVKAATAELTADIKQKQGEAVDPAKIAADVIGQMKEVDKKRQTLQQTTRAWTSLENAHARAVATDTQNQQALLQDSIDGLTAELTDLNTRFTAAKTAQRRLTTNVAQGEDTVEQLATNVATGSNGGSRWQDISIVHTSKFSTMNQSTEATAASESWSVNFWIGGGGGSSSSSAGASETSQNEKEVHMEISMKVTSVTVDRSSWFQPELFDSSKGYMRNNDNLSFNDWAKEDDPVKIASKFRGKGRPPSLNGGLLPCFPVAYILCKDVIIKVSGMDLSSDDKKKTLVEKSQSSGGFLFFSYNKSSETTKDSSAATFQMAKDGMVVRIPGPQILGYIQQIVPADNSTEYKASESLGQDFFLPGEEKTDGKAGGDPKRGFQPSTPQGEKSSTRFKMPADVPANADGSEPSETNAGGKKAHGIAPAKPGAGAGDKDKEEGDDVTARAREFVKAIFADEKMAKAVKEMMAGL